MQDAPGLEQLLFDGVLSPQPGGLLRLPHDVVGHGLALRRETLSPYTRPLSR